MKLLSVQGLIGSCLMFASLTAQAYPSANIVDALPGVYHGTTTYSQPCTVTVTQKFGKMDFQVAVENERVLSLKPYRISSLKSQYNEDFEFRKKNDSGFDPETASPELVKQTNYGIPSIFGIYPRTDVLQIVWDNTELFSVKLGVSYSKGGPIETEPDNRNVSLSCLYLKK